MNATIMFVVNLDVVYTKASPQTIPLGSAGVAEYATEYTAVVLG